MDGIKLAFCGTESAADAFIFIHDRSSASETATCFDLDLFFCERRTQIAEGFFCDSGFFTRYLSFCRVKFFDVKVVFIKLDKLTQITAKCQRVPLCTKRWMDTQPCFPAAIASMANFGPVKTSPPTKISGSAV